MECVQVTLAARMADGRTLLWWADGPADVLVTAGPVTAQVSDYWDAAADRPLMPDSVTVEILRHPGTRVRVQARARVPGGSHERA
jgi:hypothetical protein